MNSDLYLALCFADLVIMIGLIKLSSTLLDMWYKRKDRPKKILDIICPRTGQALTSEEVFFGMCGSCHRINNNPELAGRKYCNGGIKKVDHVKS